jgi:glycerol-3-phosphate dehydrogenase (NAD(P)+)
MVLSRARRKHDISLWVHDPALAESIRRDRENKIYLPGQYLAPEIRVSHNFEEVLAEATLIVGAMPAAHARSVYTEVRDFIAGIAWASAEPLDGQIIFVSATKGLEPATHLRITEVIAQVLPPEFATSLAVLSGPSFAAEAARGEPTAVVLASQSQKVQRSSTNLRRYTPLLGELQEEFAAPNFRVYTNDDVLGVELAGAMKNVIAIAAGVCQGLGLGSNPLAALITRGLAEMSRLAAALGAQPETLTGLAGLGDLVLTCTGALSRNRQVGIELGKGRSLTEILAGMRMVAEGVGTTAALLALASEAKVELPITEQVRAILHQGKPPREAIRDIMDRPQKRE